MGNLPRVPNVTKRPLYGMWMLYEGEGGLSRHKLSFGEVDLTVGCG